MAEKKHTQDPLDMEEALSTSEAFIICLLYTSDAADEL